MSCNSFSAVVRVVSDVESATVGKNNTPLAKCRSVHDTSYRDGSSLFMGLNFWNNKAGAAEKIVSKGDQLFVRGNLEAREYQGKTYFDLSVDDFFKVNGVAKKEKVQEQAEPLDVSVDVEEEIPF